MEHRLAPVEHLDEEQVVADLVEQLEIRLEPHHRRLPAEAPRTGVAVRTAQVADVRRLDDEENGPGAQHRPDPADLVPVQVEIGEPLPREPIAVDVFREPEGMS